MSASTKTAPLYGAHPSAATALSLFTCSQTLSPYRVLVYNPALPVLPDHRMFTPDQLTIIAEQLAHKPDRTQLVEVDGTPVIIKRLGIPLKHWSYPVLDTLACVLCQPMLRAVPTPGSSAAQSIEIARLRALATAGVSVPEVLHVTPHWFAISFLGATSIDQLLRQQAEQGLDYWESGLQAILELHRLCQTASQCFARNMIWHEGKVSFINFEDNPSSVMPMASAQARDWLLYLHSTAYILDIDAQQITQHFLHYLQQDGSDVQEEVMRAARTFGWLRMLPKQHKPPSRDAMSVQATAQVLHLAARELKNRD